MTACIGTHKGFLCHSHRYGTYAVRDGEEPGKPAGPRYAYVETDEDGDISAAIDEHIRIESASDEELMEERADEIRWGVTDGPAGRELSRRHPEKGIAA